MHKIFLITAREYITRVKNKTFLLTTFLTPLGILLFIVAASFIMTRGSDSDKYIVVLDKSNLLQKTLDAGEHLKFNYVDEDLNSLKEDVKSNKYFGVLEIQPLTDSLAESYSILFHSDQQLAIDESSAIKGLLKIKSENTNSKHSKSTLKSFRKSTLKSASSRKQSMKKNL